MTIISTYSLLPLISSLFVIVLGFFVWLKKPREWLHTLFFLYAFVIAVWLFGTFLLFNSTAEAEQVRWDRFIYAAVIFIPIFLYHFGLIYCGLVTQRLFLISGYLLAFIFLPISQTDLFVSGVYKYSWGIHTVAQTWHHLFLAYFFFYFIFFFINLSQYYRRSEGIRKKQIGYLLIGYGILDVIGPLAFLPAYGIPIHPIIFLSAVPFALVLAYAIIRHNALDIKTITAEVIVTVLNLVTLTELFFSRSSTEFVLRGAVLAVIFVFSVFLVRAIKKEIQRREEITNLARALKEANARLQELDAAKSEFLGIAAHQLRTPLSIIKGYISMILEGDYGQVAAAAVKPLQNVYTSNEQLIHLVDDFLDVTRIETGRVELNLQPTDLKKVTAGVLEELSGRALAKKLKIKTKLSAVPAIPLDSEKIRHVIFNFLDNAINYTEHGEILVSLEATSEEAAIVFTVQDTGVGFDADDQKNFFQKFYRGRNVKGVNINGTGLGLFICRKFIEAQGGEIWAASPGSGRGSTFGFRLPVSK